MTDHKQLIVLTTQTTENYYKNILHKLNFVKCTAFATKQRQTYTMLTTASFVVFFTEYQKFIVDLELHSGAVQPF